MYFLVNLILIIVTLSMGTVFLVFPVPNSLGLKSYKISLKFLASAYLIIAFLNFVLLIYDLDKSVPEYFSFINLLISSLQALLFTFTLITLLNPEFVGRKRLTNNLFAVFVFPFAYLILYLVFGDCTFQNFSNLNTCVRKPSFVLRFVFFLFYCAQLVYFVVLYLKERKIFKEKLNEYFSETTQLRLNWLTYAFFSALLIGLLALGFQVFPRQTFEILFPMIITVFYFVFAVKYINYNKLYLIIEPVLELGEQKNKIQSENSRINTVWGNYKAKILSEQYYLIEGITLEEMANFLKVGRTTLSNIINSQENVNFNTWINRLRVEEAKKLFLEKPDFSIIRIAEMTGFSEHSNFSRQFKLITGESPSVWRKKMQHKFVVLQ